MFTEFTVGNHRVSGDNGAKKRIKGAACFEARKSLLSFFKPPSQQKRSQKLKQSYTDIFFNYVRNFAFMKLIAFANA